MGIAAEGGLYVLGPFLLPLRVFLSPDCVDVMWEQSGGLIGGVPQTAARHPALQATRRGRPPCKHNNRVRKRKPIASVPPPVGGGSLPMFQVPTNTEITSGSLCWECLIFISWSRWQKASRFWRTEGFGILSFVFRKQHIDSENDSSSRWCPLTRALSNIISRGVLWWLSITMRILLWSLTT